MSHYYSTRTAYVTKFSEAWVETEQEALLQDTEYAICALQAATPEQALQAIKAAEGPLWEALNFLQDNLYPIRWALEAKNRPEPSPADV